MKVNLHYKDHLGNWVFRFNIYTRNFEAVERQYYKELFNGDKGHVVKATEIDTLLAVINKKLYK